MAKYPCGEMSFWVLLITGAMIWLKLVFLYRKNKRDGNFLYYMYKGVFYLNLSFIVQGCLVPFLNAESRDPEGSLLVKKSGIVFQDTELFFPMHNLSDDEYCLFNLRPETTISVLKIPFLLLCIGFFLNLLGNYYLEHHREQLLDKLDKILLSIFVGQTAVLAAFVLAEGDASKLSFYWDHVSVTYWHAEGSLVYLYCRNCATTALVLSAIVSVYADCKKRPSEKPSADVEESELKEGLIAQ